MTTTSPFLSITAFALATTLLATATARAQFKAQVTEGPALPIAVGGHAGGLVDGNPVIVGGSGWTEDRKHKFWSDESYIYRDGNWVAGPKLPTTLADMAYAVDETGLYFAGGISGKTVMRDVFHLDSSKPDATWKTLAPLPIPIQAAAGAIHNGLFYVVGGFIDDKASARLLSLDTRNPGAAWTELAPLPAEPRGYSAFVAVNGSLYLFGGFNSPPYQTGIDIFADAYRYDPSTNQWTELKGFDLPGYGWTATRVDDEHVMLTGRAPRISVIEPHIRLVNLKDMSNQIIGDLIIQSCCMPVISMGPHTWWIPGGEPSTDRSRTKRVSVVKIEGESKHD